MTNREKERELNLAAPSVYLDPDDSEYCDEGCYECGGEGFITADCFEDTCCCADPDSSHGIIPCPNCNPGGRNIE